jgi:hypothetical protein
MDGNIHVGLEHCILPGLVLRRVFAAGRAAGVQIETVLNPIPAVHQYQILTFFTIHCPNMQSCESATQNFLNITDVKYRISLLRSYPPPLQCGIYRLFDTNQGTV